MTQHTPHLVGELIRVSQFAGHRRTLEFRIRLRRPQEIAQSAGEFPVGERADAGARGRVLQPIEKGRGDQDAGQQGLHRIGVVQFVVPADERIK